MGREEIKCYCTKYGDVYVGVEFHEFNMPDYMIVVPFYKINEYVNLHPSQKTPEQLSKLAQVFPKTALKEILEVQNKFDDIFIPSWNSGNFDRKTLFIIGAGASAFCVKKSQSVHFLQDELRPPLGNQLFSERFKSIYCRYPGVKQSLIDLQDEEVNVEEILENDWKEVLEASNELIMRRHINIQFYIQELLWNVTQKVISEYSDSNLFSKLCNLLQQKYARQRKKQFAFVSFNQDSILDTFLSQFFNKPLNSLDDYIDVNDSPFCLIKPHGSWNWGWKFLDNNAVNRQAELFNNRVDYHDLYFKLLGNHESMVDWGSYGREMAANKHGIGKYALNKSNLDVFDQYTISSFYPAMLLPYRDKDEFTMPYKHYRYLENFIAEAENICIIGWKGNEALFNATLIKNAHKLKRIILADPSHDIVESNLKGIIAKYDCDIIRYKDFEDFVMTGLKDI